MIINKKMMIKNKFILNQIRKEINNLIKLFLSIQNKQTINNKKLINKIPKISKKINKNLMQNRYTKRVE